MSFRIPPQVFGRPVAGAMERLLSTPQPATTSPTSTAPISAALNTGIDKGKYIMLPAKSYGTGNALGYPDLLISMDRLHLGKNWIDAKAALTQEGAVMPTIRQFADLLQLLNSGSTVYDGLGNQIPSGRVNTLLKDIIEVRDPYRAEWLGAQFSIQSSGNSMVAPQYSAAGRFNDVRHVLGDYLAKDKTPGIDLSDWLATATDLGLPRPKAKKGDLYYWQPTDGAVAGFVASSDWAFLYCVGGPQFSYSALGVRAVRAKI